MKISLHKILEETLGIGKIKSKEELEKLLADKERLKETVRVIKEITSQSSSQVPK